MENQCIIFIHRYQIMITLLFCFEREISRFHDDTLQVDALTASTKCTSKIDGDGKIVQ